MNDFIELNEGGGFYIALKLPNCISRMERSMLLMAEGPFLITPRTTLLNGEEALLYDVSRFTDLKAYIGRHGIAESFIHKIFKALGEAVLCMDNFMLYENNICLEGEHIYVADDGQDIRFLAVPETHSVHRMKRAAEIDAVKIDVAAAEADVYMKSCIDKLVEYMLKNTSPEDIGSLSLLCRLYRASEEGHMCAERLLEILPAAGPEQKDTGIKRETCESMPTAEAELSDEGVDAEDWTEDWPLYAGDSFANSKSQKEVLNTGQDEKASAPEEGARSVMNGLAARLAMAMGIMGAAAAVVIMLRGIGAFLRLLPIYAILCLAIAIWIFIGQLEKRPSKNK